jgi:acetate kinase
MPLRKYGFHGLSYASIVQSLAQHLGKKTDKINVVIAHLGSGASACCIKGGQSIDTCKAKLNLANISHGLDTARRADRRDPNRNNRPNGDIPPYPGSSRGRWCGRDESHESRDDHEQVGCSLGRPDDRQSGLQALAGTTNFGTIISRNSDPSSCSADQHDQSQLAYRVYLDRLLGYISQYLCKLLADTPVSEIDGIVFSGGIGEKASLLRADVLKHFAWLGAEVSDENDKDGAIVHGITTPSSALRAWVVKTDEEGWCAQLARDDFKI